MMKTLHNLINYISKILFLLEVFSNFLNFASISISWTKFLKRFTPKKQNQHKKFRLCDFQIVF
jgi:hypothetical protein